MAQHLLIDRNAPGAATTISKGLSMTFRKHFSTMAAALAAVACASAHAGLITINGGELAGATHYESFDGGSAGNASNQFAGSGLHFTTLSGAGISVIDNAQCGNTGDGVSGKYLYMGVVVPCNYATSEDAVSIQFDNTVSELSWTGFSRAASGGFTIEALLNGSVVSSTVFDQSNRFENGTVRISGGDFNELRFIENRDGLFFAADNFRWNDAAGSVPEPTGLALTGLALSVLALARRRKAK